MLGNSTIDHANRWAFGHRPRSSSRPPTQQHNIDSRGCCTWAWNPPPDTGAIVGYDALTLLDCIYFSASTYTTVGWGDLNAIGATRFLAGTEALVGFMLITWSASFTYLVMDRTWGKKQDD
ncbi:potassium channel family protein [Algiphilus aromaticivorans]|uniref:potassium channel family protein n=1 Tax=Algiphilus aromaticivorans TaxID=382454 RepID=UPI0018DC0F93|nr:potassium channel family protein [Algiphilus aromaticivorans]